MDGRFPEPSRFADGNEFRNPFVAHEIGHTWEHWPDRYDYDVLDPDSGSLVNFPIGYWCLMTNHDQLVHPIPPLKESSNWIEPVDLATVLMPGMPGRGLLIEYVDLQSNGEALPPQYNSGTQATYKIVPPKAMMAEWAGSILAIPAIPGPVRPATSERGTMVAIRPTDGTSTA